MYVWLPQLFVFLFSIFSFILRPIRFIFLEVLTLKPFLTHALNDLTCLQLFLNMTWFNVIRLEKKKYCEIILFLTFTNRARVLQIGTRLAKLLNWKRKDCNIALFFSFSFI